MNTVTLKSGLAMPLIGLGTWKSKHGVVRAAVYDALKIGYRHIDCAWMYKNQTEVGEGIAQAIEEGVVTREDIWVTSKIWNEFHGKNDVEPHIQDILQQLQLSYLDMCLIHWPATNVEAEEVTPSYRETWEALQAVHMKGLVRTIGVSNMTIKKIEAMKEYAIVWPSVNQVEMHPLWRQDELLAYCKSEGIHVTAYAPLGSSDSAVNYKHNGHTLLEHETVHKIAKDTGKTPGQVLIRWALQRGTSVVPKSANKNRIEENFQVFDWELSEEQFHELSTLEPQKRMLRGEFLIKEGGPYKSAAEVWDEA